VFDLKNTLTYLELAMKHQTQMRARGQKGYTVNPAVFRLKVQERPELRHEAGDPVEAVGNLSMHCFTQAKADKILAWFCEHPIGNPGRPRKPKAKKGKK
jgi:hypothetical protein